jgi:hypothetical protein
MLHRPVERTRQGRTYRVRWAAPFLTANESLAHGD